MMNSRLQLSASLVLFLLVRAGSAEDFNPRAMLEDAAKQPDRIVCRKLWTSKQAVRLFQGLSISKDGKLVGASTNDDRCIVFDGDSGEVVMQASKVEGLLKDQGSLITSTSLSADGSRIAIAQYSGELAVLNTSNFDEVRRFPRTNKSIHAMHLTPDGKTLSWVDREGTFSRSELAAAETQSQKFNWNFQGKLLELFSFSDSGRLLAYRAGPHAKEIYLMHLAAAPEEPQQPTIHSEEAAICLALAPESLAYVTNQGVRYVHKLPLGDVNKPPEKPLLRQVIFVSPNAQESRFMAYSSDGKLSFILGRGQVEIHGQDWTYLSILVDADFDFAAQACWATDAKRFAIVDPQGYVSLYEIQGEIDHPGWAFRRKLDQLQKNSQFEELERIAETLQSDHDTFAYFQDQAKYRVFLDLIDRSEASLAAWKEARPDSTLLALVRADRLVGQAWEARGEGFASDVTSEGHKTFQQGLAEAWDILAPLLEVEQPPPEAFTLAFHIATGQSWEEERWRPLADRLLAVAPSYSRPHEQMVLKLLRRWGGERSSSSEYAKWVADRIGGVAGDMLYTQMAIRVGNFEPSQFSADEGLFDVPRALRGAQALQATHRRAFGLLAELELALLTSDQPRAFRLAKTIEREKRPYVRYVLSGCGTRGRTYFDQVLNYYTTHATE